MTDAEGPVPVLRANGLEKHYPITRGVVVRRAVGQVRAVDGVSLVLHRGETLAIVGESGCGKSTLGRLLLALEPPTDGTVWVTGDTLGDLNDNELRRKRREIQLILQDPYTSLNPRMTVGAIVAEPFAIHKESLPGGQDRRGAVRALLAEVGLSPELMNRYPHQFSGGQRQRIGIARALALRPGVIVADEPVSALDVSVQAQVLNLLADLQERRGLSYVFISHDLAVVRQIADRVAVMYLGRIVETAPVDAIYDHAAHPYTQALLAAVPSARSRGEERPELNGDVPSAVDPPSGCRFRTRCWKAQDLCATQEPQLREVGTLHEAACHFPETGAASSAARGDLT